MHLFMRTSLLVAGMVGFAVASFAADSNSSTAWRTTGAVGDAFSGAMPATLAPATEVYRDYAGGAVVLQLKSSPRFGALPAEWPVLQVGPTAVVFILEQGLPRICVLHGNKTTTLTLDLAATADGSTSQSVELILGYDPASGAAVLSHGGKLHYFASSTGRAPVEISLAAGESSSWELSSLNIVAVEAETPAPTTSVSSSDVGAAEAARISTAIQSVSAALRAPLDGSTNSAGVTNPTTTTKSLPPDYIPLEISTPPAVRRSAAEIRAALAQTLTVKS